jgi:hypothetical protein
MSAICFLLQLGGYEDLPGRIIFVATFCIWFKVAECPPSSLLEVDPSMEIPLWTSESANEKDDLLQCLYTGYMDSFK